MKRSIFTFCLFVYAFSTFAHESSCQTELYKTTQGKIDEVVHRISDNELKNLSEDYFQRYCNSGDNHNDASHKCEASITTRNKMVYLDAQTKTKLSDVRFQSISCQNKYDLPYTATGPLRKCWLYHSGSGSLWTPFGSISGSSSNVVEAICVGKIAVSDDTRPTILHQKLGEVVTVKYRAAEKMKCRDNFDPPSEYPIPAPKGSECGIQSVLEYSTGSNYVIFDSEKNVIFDHTSSSYMDKKIDYSEWSMTIEDGEV